MRAVTMTQRLFLLYCLWSYFNYGEGKIRRRSYFLEDKRGTEMNFGQYIKLIRLERGVTLRDFCRQIDIDVLYNEVEASRRSQ